MAHSFVYDRWTYSSTAVHQARSDGLPIRLCPRPGMPIKKRFVTALLNISSCLELGIYRSTMDEGLAGLLERVYYVSDGNGGWRFPPRPDATFYKVQLKESVRDLYLYPVADISVDEFLSRYKGAKLTAYRRAAEELRVFGLDLNRHTFVGAFVKDERQLRGKAPRLIRPFSIIFNLAFGVFVYPLEKCLYSGIDALYESPTVTKGLNGSQVASAIAQKWNMFGDPVCLITDMSRFDQHCSPEALRWVMRLCLRALKRGGADVKRFVELWESTIRSRGMVLCDDGVVQYKVDGTLNSGLSSTSLCGVVLVCFILRAFCMSRKVKHQLISAGDDTNIIIEREDLTKFDDLPAFCLSAGFTVKIDGVVDELERIDFCQARPVFDGEEWVMVRDPKVVATKDLLTGKRFASSMDVRRYMRAIADGGLALNGGIPIMQSYYAMLRRLAGDVEPSVLERNGFYYLTQNMRRSVRAITDHARISFYKAFGINVWRQMELERYYDRVQWDGKLGLESVESLPFSSDLKYAFEEN